MTRTWYISSSLPATFYPGAIIYKDSTADIMDTTLRPIERPYPNPVITQQKSLGSRQNKERPCWNCLLHKTLVRPQYNGDCFNMNAFRMIVHILEVFVKCSLQIVCTYTLVRLLKGSFIHGIVCVSILPRFPYV